MREVRFNQDVLDFIETSVRSTKPLSVILGDKDSGKTLTAHELMKIYASARSYEIVMLDASHYSSEFQFIKELCRQFGLKKNPRSIMGRFDMIQQYIAALADEQQKSAVLVIDNGHYLTLSLIETLMTLINFKRSGRSLMHIVIFARTEFIVRIQRLKNVFNGNYSTYIINLLDDAAA